MITIKDEREIELMRHAGMLVSKMHKYLKPFIKEGITTKELDRLAEEFIVKNKGVPSCKGYEGFPATLCTSVNDMVVHGIPDNTKLKNGDTITLEDMTGRVITYQVYNKYIVKPTNTKCTSQLTNGKREVTLITCANYGTERLIVKCREV